MAIDHVRLSAGDNSGASQLLLDECSLFISYIKLELQLNTLPESYDCPGDFGGDRQRGANAWLELFSDD